jgi:hypothetical protein
MSRPVKLSPRETTKVAVTMNRPAVNLSVITSPAGATVTVGGRTVGSTPVTTQIRGYERVSVKVTKTGYQSAGKTVYGSDRSLTARFTLKKSSSNRPAAKPPTGKPATTPRRPSSGLLP